MDEGESIGKGGIQMAIVSGIRKWLDSIINNFRCGLYGHNDVVILHKYESEIRPKISAQIRGKNFTQVKSQLLEQYKEKCHCRGCGETFIRMRHGAWH